MTRLKLCIPAFLLLLPTCSDVPSAPRSTSTSSTSTVSTAARSELAAIDVLLLKLDAKTSIPYEERNRTDERYFHGFRILKSVRLKEDGDIRRVTTFVHDIARVQWRSDLVRDADYGIRTNGKDGNDDLLLCMYCKPPIVTLPTDASEAEISPGDSESLRKILTAALENEVAR